MKHFAGHSEHCGGCVLCCVLCVDLTVLCGVGWGGVGGVAIPVSSIRICHYYMMHFYAVLIRIFSSNFLISVYVYLISEIEMLRRRSEKNTHIYNVREKMQEGEVQAKVSASYCPTSPLVKLGSNCEEKNLTYFAVLVPNYFDVDILCDCVYHQIVSEANFEKEWSEIDRYCTALHTVHQVLIMIHFLP